MFLELIRPKLASRLPEFAAARDEVLASSRRAEVNEAICLRMGVRRRREAGH
jgi:hypothetical protein